MAGPRDNVPSFSKGEPVSARKLNALGDMVRRSFGAPGSFQTGAFQVQRPVSRGGEGGPAFNIARATLPEGGVGTYTLDASVTQVNLSLEELFGSSESSDEEHKIVVVNLLGHTVYGTVGVILMGTAVIEDIPHTFYAIPGPSISDWLSNQSGYTTETTKAFVGGDGGFAWDRGTCDPPEGT